MSHLKITLALLIPALAGCGTIREKRATDQLLLSDAVDRSVAFIDFSPLAHQKVYFDTRFLEFKNQSSLTTNYVISALRQQMIVARCELQDNVSDADVIVEARIGALGADGHDMNFGVPASNALNDAATLVAAAPPLPALPEVSLARRTKDMAASKIAVFAYNRDTRQPVWQSGNAVARSEATGIWVLGAGPLQLGSIYHGAEFAGDRLQAKRIKKKDYQNPNLTEVDREFRRPWVHDEVLRQQVRNGEHLIAPDTKAPEGGGPVMQANRGDDGTEQR